MDWGRRAALAAGGAAWLAGCAGRRDPRALRFWGMSYEGDYAPHLTTGFTAATGIPVEVQSLPWTAAHEKLLTARAGGSLPDVLMLPNGWVGEFAMIGALAPVADRALLADMFPGVLDTIRYRGRDWAVPWSVAPQMQFFRTDILAQAGYSAPPADWAAWKAMGHAIKRRRPDSYAFLMLLNWWDALFTFIGQTGARPLRANDTRGAFRQPAIRAAFAFYLSLFAEGLAPAVLSTELQDPFAAFAQGYFAVFPYAPSLLLDLRRRAAELPRSRWGLARMPGPRGPGPSSAVSSSLAVTAASSRPAEAWALVRHMTSAASELRFQTMIGNLPARTRAWDAPQLQGTLMRPLFDQMRDPAASPNIIEWERVRTEVQLVAERAVRGELGIDAALAEMDARTDAVLATRRALVEAGRIA